MSSITIEWAPFTLAAGADEASLLSASEALQSEFLSQQRGFLRRELLKGNDGQWVDLIYWEDAESANAAMQAAAESAECLAYFRLMANADQPDFASSVVHFTMVRDYTPLAGEA